MKVGHGSGNLECPAAHYYASQVVNLPHKVSQSNSQNSKSEPRYEIRGKIKQTTSRPPPPESDTECSTDDSAVVTGDVETDCTSYM